MAFSQLLCMSTIDTSGGAGTAQVGMTSGVRAATVVLVVGVFPPADQAYHCLLVFTAGLCCVVEGPATLALLDKGTRHELTNAGLMPKHEGRVMGHVL